MARIRIKLGVKAEANNISILPVPRAYEFKELGSNLLRLRLGDRCSDLPNVAVIEHGFIRVNPDSCTVVQMDKTARVSLVQLSGKEFELLRHHLTTKH